jgi:hypothetical protein
LKMAHVQVWVKVNATVDHGIAQVIAALSRFPTLRTIESCEGDVARRIGRRGAWVCFSYGEPPSWDGISRFVLRDFGPALARKVGDRAHVRIRVTEGGQILAELTIRPGAIRIVARAIHDLARKL